MVKSNEILKKCENMKIATFLEWLQNKEKMLNFSQI